MREIIFLVSVFPIKLLSKGDFMYHQQQNKCYPSQRFLLAHFGISKLHSILVVPNLLAHNNITISYYVQVNTLRLK